MSDTSWDGLVGEDARIIEPGESVMEAGRTVVCPRRVVVGSKVNATIVANGRDRNKLLQSFTMTKLY